MYKYAFYSRKLQKELGWKPSLQFEEGIEETVKWYQKTPHLFSDEEHFLEMEVDFLQPFLDIEARTALANPGEVAMT